MKKPSTAVGVFIEVPVMMMPVKICLRTQTAVKSPGSGEQDQ